MSSPYDRVVYHGHTLNRRTMSMVQMAEDYLGYEMTILQGSYHKGVGASAGTHDGGGAVDFAPADQTRKIMVLRLVGFAAWHRTPIPGVWPEHIHAIAIKDKQMSSAAVKQIQDYYAHLNGLAGHGYDSEWRPHVIVPFQYPPPRVDRSNVYAQAEHPNSRLGGVMCIQRALNTKTGTHLKVDGVYGPDTKSAFGRYEKQVGETVNGLPNISALKRLGLALFRVKE